MTPHDAYQARREVDHLLRLAGDANREGLYATAEALLEQAATNAEQLDDLPLLVHTRFELAEARRRGLMKDLQIKTAAEYAMPGAEGKSVVLKIWPKNVRER